MTRLFFGISTVLWGAVLMVGIQLYRGIVAQAVPGFPNSGQLRLYVVAPCVLMLSNLLLAIALKRASPGGLVALAFLQIFLLSVVFFFGGGGI